MPWPREGLREGVAKVCSCSIVLVSPVLADPSSPADFPPDRSDDAGGDRPLATAGKQDDTSDDVTGDDVTGADDTGADVTRVETRVTAEASREAFRSCAAWVMGDSHLL